MTALPPKNKDEYFQMLNTANNLNDTGLLKTSALIKIVITKSPENLRSLLFQVAGNNYDWQEVFKIAQESLWIVYPTSVDFSIDRNELDGTKKNYFKRLPRYKKNGFKQFNKSLDNKKLFFCALHGMGNHQSEECSAIRKMVQNGFELKKVNKIGLEDFAEENSEEKNKDINYYSQLKIQNQFKQCFVLSKNNFNPFRGIISILNKNYNAIFDTGADISIVHKDMLKRDTRIYRCTNIKVKSASGNYLNIIGKVKKLNFQYKNQNYFLDALVTDLDPKYVILGSSFLIENPKILFNLIEKKVSVNSLHKQSDTLTLEKNIILKFNDVFQTEIDKMTICNQGAHHIKTTSQ
ncbi:hypothetical protein GVAV_002068 [Gurleya vavrai]